MLPEQGLLYKWKIVFCCAPRHQLTPITPFSMILNLPSGQVEVDSVDDAISRLIPTIQYVAAYQPGIGSFMIL